MILHWTAESGTLAGKITKINIRSCVYFNINIEGREIRNERMYKP